MCNGVLSDDHSPPHCSGLEVKCSCVTDQGIQRIPHWEQYRCSTETGMYCPNGQCHKHSFSWSGSRDEPSPYVLCTHYKSGHTESLQSGHSSKVAGKGEESDWLFFTAMSGQQKFFKTNRNNWPCLSTNSSKMCPQDVGHASQDISQDMLERLLEQQPAICAALMSRDLRRGEEDNILKDKDFCDVVKLMAPVKLVTTSMCEDKRPTLSMISPARAKLKKNFEASDEDSVVIREMKSEVSLQVRKDLEKRYTDLDDLYYTAAALDPRFKSLPFLTDHDAERIFTSITAEATSLHNNVNPPTHCHLLNTKYILQCILLVTNSLLCFAAVIRFILTAFTVCLIVCTTH